MGPGGLEFEETIPVLVHLHFAGAAARFGQSNGSRAALVMGPHNAPPSALRAMPHSSSSRNRKAGRLPHTKL